MSKHPCHPRYWSHADRCSKCGEPGVHAKVRAETLDRIAQKADGKAAQNKDTHT